jgi:hypothetical protein
MTFGRLSVNITNVTTFDWLPSLFFTNFTFEVEKVEKGIQYDSKIDGVIF